MLDDVGTGFVMAPALAAFSLKTTGEPINIAIVNAGTFVATVCFRVASYLLLPPVRRAGEG